MGFKQQVAAVKVQSRLRTYLARKKLNKEQVELQAQYREQQKSGSKPTLFKCPICRTGVFFGSQHEAKNHCSFYHEKQCKSLLMMVQQKAANDLK